MCYDIVSNERNPAAMNRQKLMKWEYGIIALYFILYCVIALSLIFRQPFGNPPDEYNRYLIPQYIAIHGTLPNGYEESIRIPGYGFSYAFQPILPYMIQGYVMRIALHFVTSFNSLVLTARLVDFVFGLIMAVFVLLLARKWFTDRRLQYLFCYLVMFLPQSIFIHTYVNTDSCCMMSIAIMLYGLTCCLQDHFAYPSCITMSIGIIFCALSYYNAYGFILSCILLFTANYLSLQNNRLRLDLKPFLKKGLFISAIVLLGIGWWFIRSYILYDGDFLGLRTRDACSVLYGNENMKPGTKITYQTLGYTVPRMLFDSDFLVLTINSFISMYGPMVVHTALWIYRFYKLLFASSLLLCLAPSFSKKAGNRRADDGRCGVLPADRPAMNIFFHVNMVFCILMPFVLSVIYSYRIDYQPQGRYIMPILIPLGYYCVYGIGKGVSLAENLLTRFCAADKPVSQYANRLLTGLFACILFLIVVSLLVTVYGYAFPYYEAL